MAIRWRIQDFPEGVPTPGRVVGGDKVLFGILYFTENFVKIAEIGPRVKEGHPWHPLPFRVPQLQKNLQCKK